MYERRELLRILGMRRTMFVVPARLAPTIHHSSTAALIGPERRRVERLVEEEGLAKDGPAWVSRVAASTLSSLEARGTATAVELREDVPELRTTLTIRKKDGSVMGTVGMSTRILFLMATEGRIVRGRPRGTWLSSQYEWSTHESWAGEPLTEVDPAVARTEVVARWLAAFGPGTETDIKWWTGWPVTKVRTALDAANAIEVGTDAGTAYVHPDFKPPSEPPPWAAFLPGLDPTVMGWKQRGWYLGEHASRLFDRNGNAGPTIMVDGRVVGAWAQKETGDVVYRLLEQLDGSRSQLVEDEAARLQEWLGEFVVTPRFRTPLERELSGR